MDGRPRQNKEELELYELTNIMQLKEKCEIRAQKKPSKTKSLLDLRNLLQIRNPRTKTLGAVGLEKSKRKFGWPRTDFVGFEGNSGIDRKNGEIWTGQTDLQPISFQVRQSPRFLETLKYQQRNQKNRNLSHSGGLLQSPCPELRPASTLVRLKLNPSLLAAAQSATLLG